MNERAAVMTDEQIEELWIFIGNVIRLATIVEPGDATIARDAAERAAVHTVLLEPRLTPTTPQDHLINRRLLEAFAVFRKEIELVRKLPMHDTQRPSGGASLQPALSSSLPGARRSMVRGD